MERTLIIFKPDAVQRGLCGEILSRFERKGLQVVGMKMTQIPRSLAETHYEAHKAKPFYAGLVGFMTSSPVIILALAGKGRDHDRAEHDGRDVRQQGGARDNSRGLRRFQFVQSDSWIGFAGSSAGELGLFFKPEELVDWKPAVQTWVYDMSKGVAE